MGNVGRSRLNKFDKVINSLNLAPVKANAEDPPPIPGDCRDQRGVTGDRWMFLTGERDELYKLSKEGFHLAVDDTIGTEIEPITHSTRFALVDGRGNIRGYYDGTAMETVAQLSQDVENLLSERD